MFSKTMREFEYHAPADLDEALCLLAEYGDKAKAMLGGTDLVPKMKAQAITPEHIIALKQIPELKQLSFDEKDGLRIGAAVTLYDLEKFGPLKRYYPALYEGVHAIASTQIRDVGTIVGNICNAVPSADSAPALLVLNAELLVESKAGGRRVVPVKEFFTGVCKTILKADELVTEIHVPVPEGGTNQVYYAHTVRRALDLAMVGVAAAGRCVEGKACNVEIALGAVATTPKRALNAEALIDGRELSDELIAQAATVAAEEDCAPITDMRATADYRREIVRALTVNALTYVRDGMLYGKE